jgi:SAM-dependent methyltransferase
VGQEGTDVVSSQTESQPPSLPHLYTDLAGWWPLLSAPAEYAAEAAWFRRVILEAAERPVASVLELGCGGGNNASHLKRDFALTLVDLAPAMLEVSRALNPECAHVAGDMRTLRLQRDFDAVFIHDAVMYLTTEADLQQMLATALAHCRPGGVVLVAPDWVRETLAPKTSHGGHDGEDGRALRYLEWVWDPDPSDITYVVDFAFLLRAADGQVRTESDRHVCGVFPRATWLALMTEAGFRTRVVVDDCKRDVFLGVRPYDGRAEG